MSNKNIQLKYAALVLALVAAAGCLTVYLTRKGSQSLEETAFQEPYVENLAASTQSTQPSQTTSSPAVSSEAAPAFASDTIQESAQPSETKAERAALKTAMPVSGEAIGAYAVDCLSYNETTRDWRVHNGVDYAAEPGAPVAAAADGTVYTTYEDDSLGYTVVIRHEGGYTTRYSSLGESLCVSPGDTVTLGQTIGYAADTALVESAMGAHVHFSVSCQDQPMDPEEFFSMG